MDPGEGVMPVRAYAYYRDSVHSARQKYPQSFMTISLQLRTEHLGQERLHLWEPSSRGNVVVWFTRTTDSSEVLEGFGAFRDFRLGKSWVAEIGTIGIRVPRRPKSAGVWRSSSFLCEFP